MRQRKIKYICETCKQDELVFDTTSRWSAEEQAFVHLTEYDHKPCCNSDACLGHEVNFQVIDVETLEHLDLVMTGGECHFVTIVEAKRIRRENRERMAREQLLRDRDRAAEAIARDNTAALSLAYDAMAEAD